MVTVRIENTKADQVSLEKWAEYTIMKWQRAIAKYKLINTGALLRSFASYVQGEAGGNSALIKFTFLYYLRMLDMGVGRGVPKNRVGDPDVRRRAYPVYSSILMREVYKLRDLLGKQWAGLVVDMVINSI